MKISTSLAEITVSRLTNNRVGMGLDFTGKVVHHVILQRGQARSLIAALRAACDEVIDSNEFDE